MGTMMTSSMPPALPKALLPALVVALSLSACGGGKDKGRGQTGPAEVGYVVVQPTSAAIAGFTYAYVDRRAGDVWLIR